MFEAPLRNVDALYQIVELPHPPGSFQLHRRSLPTVHCTSLHCAALRAGGVSEARKRACCCGGGAIGGVRQRLAADEMGLG